MSINYFIYCKKWHLHIIKFSTSRITFILSEAQVATTTTIIIVITMEMKITAMTEMMKIPQYLKHPFHAPEK